MNFFEKFFGYFKDESGSLEPYTDGLGKGFMDIRHLIWVIIAIIIVIILVKLSKKNKTAITKFCKYVLIFMFLQRFINQMVRAVLMIENPFWRAIFPIHLCTIMIYLLPIVVVFNLEKIKKPVYYLSVLGGVITILDGDYFSSLFLPFSVFEGTFAHTVLVAFPIVLMKMNNEHFTLKDVKKIFIILGIIATWATMFNMILLHMGHGPNYLYLVRNMLPIGGKYFVYIYLAIFTIILITTYLLNNIKRMKQLVSDVNNNKYKILLSTVLIIIYTYILIILNNLFM